MFRVKLFNLVKSQETDESELEKTKGKGSRTRKHVQVWPNRSVGKEREGDEVPEDVPRLGTAEDPRVQSTDDRPETGPVATWSTSTPVVKVYVEVPDDLSGGH